MPLVGAGLFGEVDDAQGPQPVQQGGFSDAAATMWTTFIFRSSAHLLELLLGDLAPHHGGGLLVAQVDADDPDVLLGLGDLDLFKQVHPLGRGAQLLLQKLHLAAEGLFQSVQPGDLPQAHGGGVHPQG